MNRIAILCCAAVLAGCAKSGEKSPEQFPADHPPLSLAEVAGRWSMKTMNETKDSTLITFELGATADTSGWTFNFPGRPPVPVRVSVSGNAVVLDAGPYASVLRKGVQVTTHGAYHLEGGKLVGTTIVHYATTAADSVRRLPAEGTKLP